MRDLRTLATTCEFVQDGKNFTEQMIRDRLVCGMTSAKVQQRLLEKGDPALAECVKECRTTAATSCQAAEIHTTMSKVKQEPREQKTRDILYTQQAGPRRSSYSKSGLGTACKFCNRQHGKRNCPAFGQVCRSCGRRNHFAVVCKHGRSRDRQPGQKVWQKWRSPTSTARYSVAYKFENLNLMSLDRR